MPHISIPNILPINAKYYCPINFQDDKDVILALLGKFYRTVIINRNLCLKYLFFVFVYKGATSVSI